MHLQIRTRVPRAALGPGAPFRRLSLSLTHTLTSPDLPASAGSRGPRHHHPSHPLPPGARPGDHPGNGRPAGRTRGARTTSSASLPPPLFSAGFDFFFWLRVSSASDSFLGTDQQVWASLKKYIFFFTLFLEPPGCYFGAGVGEEGYRYTCGNAKHMFTGTLRQQNIGHNHMAIVYVASSVTFGPSVNRILYTH